MHSSNFDWLLNEDDRDGERGQTLVEYVMVVSIVSVTLMATLVLLAGGVESLFQQIIDAVEALT